MVGTGLLRGDGPERIANGRNYCISDAHMAARIEAAAVLAVLCVNLKEHDRSPPDGVRMTCELATNR